VSGRPQRTHLPSVFAEVAHYRAFITSAAPRWKS